jgi:hypothetical protein
VRVRARAPPPGKQNEGGGRKGGFITGGIWTREKSFKQRAGKGGGVRAGAGARSLVLENEPRLARGEGEEVFWSESAAVFPCVCKVPSALVVSIACCVYELRGQGMVRVYVCVECV